MLQYLLGSTRNLGDYAQATVVFVVELKPKNKDLYIEEIQTSVKFDNVCEVGSHLLELIAEDLTVDEIIDVLLALEATGRAYGIRAYDFESQQGSYLFFCSRRRWNLSIFKLKINCFCSIMRLWAALIGSMINFNLLDM